MTLHGPVVNLNGASRESLIEQHKAVIDAAGELLSLLARASPHGRDYQTAPANLHHEDYEAWKIHALAVDRIYNDYRRITERLATEPQ